MSVEVCAICDIAGCHHIRARQAERQQQASWTPPAAWADVVAERRRQVEVEGWTPDHDDQWQNGELPRAARAYALSAHVPDSVRDMFIGRPPSHWPWAREWWKPTTRRRDLVKAAAMILAEIERLDRAAPLPVGGRND